MAGALLRPPQGHRRTKTFRTKADAIAWLDATRTDIRRGDWIDPTHLAEYADADRTRRLIFTSDDSTPLRRSNFRRRVWLPAIKAAGLPSPATFHALRHACASWLIADGANPLEVAEKLRHTRVSTTLGVYGHLFEGVDQRLDSLLEARFASSALAGD